LEDESNKTALDCAVCPFFRDADKGNRPSSYETMARKVLEVRGVKFEVDIRVLKLHFSSADIYVNEADCQLLIMLDGEGHFQTVQGHPV